MVVRQVKRHIHIYTHNKCSKIDFKNCWSIAGECKLLEEVGLYEGIGLHALSLLHSHLQTITADETCCHLQ